MKELEAMMKRGRHTDRIRREAQNRPHPAGDNLQPKTVTFAIGDRVKITKTGEETVVVGVASWGDYTLKDVAGYFSARQLTRADI